LYLNVASRLSSRVRLSEETTMRTPSPSRIARRRRLASIGLTAGTIVAAWVASGAPIHLGMVTIPTP
jgi:hypothetical protein